MTVNLQNNSVLTSVEIKESAKALEKTLLFQLAGLADVIDRFIDIQLKDRINWMKEFPLAILIIMGGVLTPSQLGRYMHRSKENMTKVIDALVDEGMVKRRRGGRDRRKVQIKITPRALSYMYNVLEDVQKEEELIKSWFTPEEQNTVRSILRKFTTNF